MIKTCMGCTVVKVLCYATRLTSSTIGNLLCKIRVLMSCIKKGKKIHTSNYTLVMPQVCTRVSLLCCFRSLLNKLRICLHRFPRICWLSNEDAGVEKAFYSSLVMLSKMIIGVNVFRLAHVEGGK